MIKYFTEIHLPGLVLRDPVTMITNVMLAVCAFWCFKQVKRYVKTDPGAGDWRYFFFFLGLAASTGVIVHGFSFYTPEKVHFWIWIAMGWMQMFGIFFAQTATVKTYFKDKLNVAMMIGLLQFAVCGTIMIVIEKFATVNIDIGLGLLPIAILNFVKVSRKEAKSNLLGWGIVMAILPAVVMATKFSISLQWFNFNDIAHVLLSILTVVMGMGLVRNMKA